MDRMTGDDNPALAPDEISAVDGLYRGFPEFAAWGKLGSRRRDLWKRFAAELAERRRGADREHLDRAVRVAVRAAAIDTGAIEGLYEVDRGFTMSVAFQSFAWEQALAERGERVRELFEAQLAGYELAIDAVTGRTPLSEAWLRALHERLCAPQDTYRVLTAMGWQEQPFSKGRYKDLPNHVQLPGGSYHAYAPVASVVPEMHRLFIQLRAPAFEEAHPAEQAAYAHYALTVVHPFADGNGRAARALASVYLYKGFSIPLVVFANQRPSYLGALAAADRGDYGPWLDFVADRGVDTMQLVVESLRLAAGPQAGEIAESLGSLFSPRGRSHAELDNLALRLLGEARLRWERRVGEVCRRLRLAEVSKQIDLGSPPPGYRHTSAHDMVSVDLGTPWPAAFDVGLSFRVNIALDESNPFGFQLEVVGDQHPLDMRDADVAPELSENLKLRLDMWVQRHLGVLLNQLDEKATAELKDFR
jgi:Fic family protein